ncbi:MAG: T9SS type A sorting domain-containing protein [Candidatus Cloacimonetes bacterium]|nr:T9SS type A sorting domain-containing protein [Candidatus Cloacimonadota bacterium]
MKKFFLLTLLLFTVYSLFGILEYQRSGDGLRITFVDDNTMEQNDIKQVIALPSRNIDIIVNECEIAEYSNDGELLRTLSTGGEDHIELQNSFIMRDLYAHQFIISKTKNTEGISAVLKSIDIEVRMIDPVQVPQKISAAFLPLYRSIADNFERSYLRDASVSPSKMLIITRESLLNDMQTFIDWKNQKGIKTEVVTLEDIGGTSDDIKAYIQNIYDTSEEPADYILLTGDIDDPFQIPSFFIVSTGGDSNVTDHPYTLLEGDDYFPEMIIGRMSFDTVLELQTIIAKTLYYEKEPFMETTHWFENATLVAGNYSSAPPLPSTPVKVTKWLRDKMYNYGYNEIDEIYYPPINPGTSLITASINDGVGVVSYRGWGDANGWHYPYYHIDNLENLDNYRMLPIMTSIVCNTGDFANSVDPCFGEAWLRLGNPGNPRGGVIFVGPSDLHTSTKLNNSIFSGLWYGVLNENNLAFGSAVLRGKYELYDNFPLNREPGGDVEFYFNVYNILGDPSLSIWTTVPQNISCTIPAEVSVGTNFIEIDLTGLDGAIVTAIKDDEFSSAAVVENGSALIYLESETEGEILLTITKPNYHPLQNTINVVQANVDLGLENVSPTSAIIAGATVQLDLTLKNFGTQIANSVSANLTSNNGNVNIITASANFGDINAGSIATEGYEIEINSNCLNYEVIEFDLAISNGSTSKFQIIVSSLIFEFENVVVNDENGILEPNEESEISVLFKNIGSFDATSLDAELIALSGDVTVITSNFTVGNVSIDETATADFTIHAEEDCFVGISVPFQIDITDVDGLTTTIYFSIEVGDVEQNAPTGPDTFGYYAYDSNDQFYTNCPEYEWIEIDPQEGGNGYAYELGDDRSVTIPMPFDFPFYGEISDSLTICTNGWVALQPTWETYFRNWNIPSALGPYGMIAPYWDDLIGEEIGYEQYADMRICYYHDETENIFIVEWNECINRYDMTSIEKFQMVLYDPASYPTASGNGEIQFNYKLANNPDVDSNYATVGIENFSQSAGLLYTYADIYPQSASPLQNEFSIKFTTEEPVFVTPVVPIADFTTERTYGIAPYEVSFTNLTSPPYFYNEFIWEFDDGSATSEDRNPIHIFSDPGSYDITLSVENSEGLDEITKSGYINVFSSNDLIWPGDTNLDGIVSIEDILQIGVYWRQIGNARTTTSLVWLANDYPGGWDIDVASLADCDGNGEVNIADIIAIGLNWGATHSETFSLPLFSPEELEENRSNFEDIYYSLGNTGNELLIKNYIAREFDLPIIQPIEINNLKQNYPNPFNPETNTSYSIADNGFVELSIYNIKGQLVKELVNSSMNAGEQNVVWNGKDASGRKVGSGLYFYKLKVNGKTIDTKKMILLK